MRDGRTEPCGLEVCGCKPPPEGTVPVWSLCGAFNGWYPPRYKWSRIVGASMSDWTENDFCFLWVDEGRADQLAYRWLREWLKTPEVFAALAGIEIEGG